MADIDVQRKGPSIWPWIVGLLVLALIIWAVAEMVDTDEPEFAEVEVVEEPAAVPAPVTPTVPEEEMAALPQPVQIYLRECTERMGEPEQEMGLEHQFTVNCLQSLGNSLNTLIEREQVDDVNVEQRMESFRNSVQQLQQSDPSALTHADLTRAAAMEAATLMDAVRDAWFEDAAEVGTEVDQAQQAAQQIETEVPMLEQRDDVRTFFREAGDALRHMARHDGTAAAPAT